MLSHTSDHALRAVLAIATRYGSGPLKAGDLARSTGSPANYLSKTLNVLTKAGILKSARGPMGGFTLAMPPDRLTLERVIECFQPRRAHTHCLLGNRLCDPNSPCGAHHRWTEIMESQRTRLATTTVADLLSGSHRPERRAG